MNRLRALADKASEYAFKWAQIKLYVSIGIVIGFVIMAFTMAALQNAPGAAALLMEKAGLVR